ncbi:MAG: PspC domain-containing protein [Balneolales bacterium]
MEKTRKKTIEDHFEVEDAHLEATLEHFMADEQQKPRTSKLNTASIAGFGLLIIAVLYMLETYLIPGMPDTSGLLQTSVILGGILVLFTGLGFFTRNRNKKRGKRKHKSWDQINDQPIDSYGIRQRKRLTRSRRDKKISGVCGGIANYFNIDPTIVRVIFVILALSYGSSILIYFILAVALPKENLIDDL